MRAADSACFACVSFSARSACASCAAALERSCVARSSAVSARVRRVVSSARALALVSCSRCSALRAHSVSWRASESCCSSVRALYWVRRATYLAGALGTLCLLQGEVHLGQLRAHRLRTRGVRSELLFFARIFVALTLPAGQKLALLVLERSDARLEVAHGRARWVPASATWGLVIVTRWRINGEGWPLRLRPKNPATYNHVELGRFPAHR